MKKMVSLAMAMATVCASASAGVVTFEGMRPDVFGNGDSFSDGAVQISTRGQGGFDGALLDGTDPDRCDIAVCPSGSTYYAAFNDGAVSFGFNGDTFRLSSVDFGFILPVSAIVGFTVGQLVVTGSDGNSVARDFAPQDALSGLYGFAHWDFDGLFSQTRFTEVTFSACPYTTTGTCVNPAGNQAQFALDNVAFVPEPGSLALLAISLAGLLAARRRQSA